MGGHGVAVAPLMKAAVENGPRAVVRLRATILTQQWRPIVNTAAHDRFRVIAHARHVLHVTHVVGRARGDVVTVTFRRRTDALQFPWNMKTDWVTSLLAGILLSYRNDQLINLC